MCVVDNPMEESTIVEDGRSNGSSTINKNEVSTNTANTMPKSFSRKVLVKSAFQDDSFPQGCQFSPDGLCVLTAHSNELLLFNTEFGTDEGGDDDSLTTTTTTTPRPLWNPALKCPAGDSVRAYQWYPHMNSSDPSTCCFVGTARYGF